MIIFILLFSNKILLSQDSIIVRKHTMLSDYINFNNLSHIKQIKQIEHSKWNALDPNFIISFNKDKSVNNIIAVSRDSTFIATFYFNRKGVNYLELSKCYISLPTDFSYTLRPKTLNKDILIKNETLEYDTINGDTSYYVQKYYSYNDTLMTYMPMHDYSDTNNTNDTTFYIFKNNMLIKTIEYHSSYYYSTLNKHTKEIVKTFFYDELGRENKVIVNEFKLRYNFHKNNSELIMTKTDTIIYSYNEKGNTIYSKRLIKDLQCKDKNSIIIYYGLTKYILQKDTLLHILFFETDRKFKSKKLSTEAFVSYNKQGLVLSEKWFDVTYFLGFKKRKEFINRNFEYNYWE